MNRRVNVRGIILDDNGSLFAVKHRMRDGSEAEYWATTGGGLDPGESLHDGLTREFIEELGVTPHIGKLLFIQQFIVQNNNGEKTEKLEFFFHIENKADFTDTIDLSTPSHGFELTRVAYINPTENALLPTFLQTIDIKRYIDNDLPVYILDNLQGNAR
ncbi:MAG: NUDIX domain-containing protein [Candidatus Saccharimonadales bacterium]